MRWAPAIGIGVVLGLVAPGWAPFIVVGGALFIVRILQIRERRRAGLTWRGTRR